MILLLPPLVLLRLLQPRLQQLISEIGIIVTAVRVKAVKVEAINAAGAASKIMIMMLLMAMFAIIPITIFDNKDF